MQAAAAGSWLWTGAEVTPVLSSACSLPFLYLHPGHLLCKSSSSNVTHLGVLPRTGKQESVFSKAMGAALIAQVSLFVSVR